MKSSTDDGFAVGPPEQSRKSVLTRTKLAKLGLAVLSGVTVSIFLRTHPSYLNQGARNGQHINSVALENPADEWKDNVWPLKEQTPWDISTDFPFTRVLEYDVTEGTWLRLDVHPKSGDIVFDMLGDIYCLPSSEYLQGYGRTRARPILTGIPHDSDPHFSPDGSKLVFRSDAELGIENIWVTQWTGCQTMDVRSPTAEGELLEALKVKHKEEEALASGVRETIGRKRRRLLREGRLQAHRVTNETYRWISDARFHPSGDKVVATKWYTTSRSLAAGEGWEYEIPTSSDNTIKPGSGKRLIGRTLPLGWKAEDYGEQQIGPEQIIWYGKDSLIYAKNVRDTDGSWTYSKDVHQGINAIYATNLTTHRTTTLVSPSPGGASRPELSRDGRTLAFVRRVRDKEALVVKDLVTGSIHNIWHGLTYDDSIVFAPMGPYPSFAFTPSDDAIIIWASGQIHRVPLSTNSRGERVSGGTPSIIPFTAHIEKRIADTLSGVTNIIDVETASSQSVYAFTELRANDDGSKAVFQGAGANYVYDMHKDKLVPVPVLQDKTPYFSPSFVPGLNDLVIHARWSDVNFTSLELANVTSGEAFEITGIPLGRYYSPILCECTGLSRKIAFVKTGGDWLTGDIVATASPGLYIGQIVIPSPSSPFSKEKIEVKNIKFISSITENGDPSTTKLRFFERSAKLLVQQSHSATILDIGSGPNEFGDYKSEVVATGSQTMEIVVTPKGKNNDAAAVDFFHVYFAPDVKADKPLWSKPGNSTKGLARLSLDGGHDVVFSGDGQKVLWFLGPYLHALEVSRVSKCTSEIAQDPVNFGIDCTKKQLEYFKVDVSYPTDITRLKSDAATSLRKSLLNSVSDEELRNSDILVIKNATLLTMETGTLHDDVLRDAILVTKGGEIEVILGEYNSENYVAPLGATVLDVQGGYIVPGFIDVHAHWNGFSVFYPARSWELETFLAYGVTTLHNPSSNNARGFVERFRVERGFANGPRIFSVGDVIYGSGLNIHQDIATMDEAYSALIRIKAEGGPSSFSYKNYNLPSRASRQRLLLAARKLKMLCVPEGGMNYDWDITYIVDGMTTVEHSLPIPTLYDDVMTLFAFSGTGSTPTHIVNYGGTFGEQLVWASEDVPNDSKLRRLTRHDVLEGLSESTARPKNSFAIFNTSESTAKMVQMGLKAHIGAHGEPPLGLNYHAEMFFTKQGGLTNYEVIRAATSDAAQTLGIFSSVGSISPGKLADLVIYPPGFDVLGGDIRKSRNIQYVVRGGRVWDAETMVEIWPVKGRKGTIPPLNPE